MNFITVPNQLRLVGDEVAQVYYEFIKTWLFELKAGGRRAAAAVWSPAACPVKVK